MYLWFKMRKTLARVKLLWIFIRYCVWCCRRNKAKSNIQSKKKKILSPIEIRARKKFIQVIPRNKRRRNASFLGMMKTSRYFHAKSQYASQKFPYQNLQKFRKYHIVLCHHNPYQKYKHKYFRTKNSSIQKTLNPAVYLNVVTSACE